MSTVEVFLIALASAFEICSLSLGKGAVFSKISKDKILKLCLIFGCYQIVALFAGNLLAVPINAVRDTDFEHILAKFLAIAMILIFASIMLFISFRRNFDEEVRNDVLTWKETLMTGALSGLTGLLVGFGLGLMETDLILQLMVFVLVTLGAVIAGLYIGYRFGLKPRKAVRFLSGLVLVIVDLELVFRLF